MKKSQQSKPDSAPDLAGMIATLQILDDHCAFLLTASRHLIQAKRQVVCGRFKDAHVLARRACRVAAKLEGLPEFLGQLAEKDCPTGADKAHTRDPKGVE